MLSDYYRWAGALTQGIERIAARTGTKQERTEGKCAYVSRRGNSGFVWWLLQATSDAIWGETGQQIGLDRMAPFE
jgi:hypothetical protein